MMPDAGRVNVAWNESRRAECVENVDFILKLRGLTQSNFLGLVGIGIGKSGVARGRAPDWPYKRPTSEESLDSFLEEIPFEIATLLLQRTFVRKNGPAAGFRVDASCVTEKVGL
jgi:hypothetical protein